MMKISHMVVLVFLTGLLIHAGYAHELVVCGWDEVYILGWDKEGADGTPVAPRKKWTWRAADSSGLPAQFQDLFRTTDECKPVNGGERLLITSSGGGAALVDIATKRVLWFGRVGNAHSIELLPEGRVAVAGSTNETGNKLAVFDLEKPDRELLSEELYSGHGVVWDEGRDLLWALGYESLFGFRLVNWKTQKPVLNRVAEYALPNRGGHDLAPVPGSSDLVVTTNSSVFLFDRDRGQFRPHPQIGERKRVKGVSIHPVSGRVVYVEAEGREWWASRLRFLNPSTELQLPGERIYKARWLVRQVE